MAELHQCPECGLAHMSTERPSNPDVEIARINAESAYKIAQLQARTDRHAVDTLAEAELDVAEAQADADVAQAEVIGEAVAAGAEPEEIPVILDEPEPEPEVTDETMPPDVEDVPSHRGEHKRGLGMWG